MKVTLSPEPEDAVEMIKKYKWQLAAVGGLLVLFILHRKPTIHVLVVR